MQMDTLAQRALITERYTILCVSLEILIITTTTAKCLLLKVLQMLVRLFKAIRARLWYRSLRIKEKRAEIKARETHLQRLIHQLVLSVIIVIFFLAALDTLRAW